MHGWQCFTICFKCMVRKSCFLFCKLLEESMVWKCIVEPCCSHYSLFHANPFSFHQYLSQCTYKVCVVVVWGTLVWIKSVAFNLAVSICWEFRISHSKEHGIVAAVLNLVTSESTHHLLFNFLQNNPYVHFIHSIDCAYVHRFVQLRQKRWSHQTQEVARQKVRRL